MISSKADNVECKLLLNRLRQYVTVRDVCNYIGLSPYKLSKLATIQPSDEWLPEAERDENYHLGKIKYYLVNGVDKPIDIDNLSYKGKVLAIPVIIDGRHRYLAMLLRRKEDYINATYSGREDLYKYLAGIGPRPTTTL